MLIVRSLWLDIFSLLAWKWLMGLWNTRASQSLTSRYSNHPHKHCTRCHLSETKEKFNLCHFYLMFSNIIKTSTWKKSTRKLAFSVFILNVILQTDLKITWCLKSIRNFFEKVKLSMLFPRLENKQMFRLLMWLPILFWHK